MCVRAWVQVVMHAGPVWRPRLLPPLLMAIHPWLTCHAHSARTFAQLITCALLTQYPPGSPAWGHGPGEACMGWMVLVVVGALEDVL